MCGVHLRVSQYHLNVHGTEHIGHSLNTTVSKSVFQRMAMWIFKTFKSLSFTEGLKKLGYIASYIRV